MRYLIIEGNIGAGKTTLSQMLADDLNANLILEQFADNPYLPKFYESKEKYSFSLELSFLVNRYTQTKNYIPAPNLLHPLLIADYYFSKPSVFTQSTLKEDDYELFKKIYDIISENMPKPDLYIYLHTSVENLLNNIKKRGQVYEKN